MPINKKKNFRKVTILSKKTDVMVVVMGEVKNNFFLRRWKNEYGTWTAKKNG